MVRGRSTGPGLLMKWTRRVTTPSCRRSSCVGKAGSSRQPFSLSAKTLKPRSESVRKTYGTKFPVIADRVLSRESHFSGVSPKYEFHPPLVVTKYDPSEAGIVTTRDRSPILALVGW